MILGVRNPSKTTPELDQLGYDKSKHSVSVLQCDFADLAQIKKFSQEALGKLGESKLDYVMFNQGLIKKGDAPGMFGSRNESYFVNHLCECRNAQLGRLFAS